MKTNVNESAFHDAFIRANRGEQFSYDARSALFDYLEELEQDTGEEIELDVIALCCEWSEHECAADAATEYGWSPPERDDDEGDDAWEERKNEDAADWLDGETHCIRLDSGSVVILQF